MVIAATRRTPDRGWRKVGAVCAAQQRGRGDHRRGARGQLQAIRNAALQRARSGDRTCATRSAVVVLGSATPSLESWERAQRGQATLIELPQRAGGANPPRIDVVDLRVVMKDALEARVPQQPYDHSVVVLSPPLAAALETRIRRGEQSLLLLNRRGYASFVQCQACGELEVCPHCSISLTYHRVPESLVCHYCQYHAPVPNVCARCGSEQLRKRGTGTQQVERIVAERFPTARIARMDVDTTTGKWAHTAILDRVGAGDVDILLGTQMIAKGLDFPNVTLVGVVDAGHRAQSSRFPSRRTDISIARASCRARRTRAKGGEVFIQTRMPGNHAVKYAVANDFHGFVNEELEARRDPLYPPFTSLANVIVSSDVQSKAAASAREAYEWVASLIKRTGLADIELVGPAPCPIDRIKDRWRWHFMLKSSSSNVMTRVAGYVAQRCPVRKQQGVRLIVDRDPVSLL